MAIDVQKTLIDACWSAISARGISSANVMLVKTSDKDYLDLANGSANDGQYPQIYILGTGGNRSRWQRSFGSNLSATLCDSPVALTETFDVRLVSDFMTDGKLMPLELQIEAALHELCTPLLASPIRPAPPEWRKSRQNTLFAGTQRTIVTWNVTIECHPYRSQLIS